LFKPVLWLEEASRELVRTTPLSLVLGSFPHFRVAPSSHPRSLFCFCDHSHYFVFLLLAIPLSAEFLSEAPKLSKNNWWLRMALSAVHFTKL